LGWRGEAPREAARAGSEVLDLPEAVRGEKVSVDPAGASRAARAYLAAAGVDGAVHVSDGSVTVSTRVVYTPVFLAVIGVGPLDVTATASARPVTPGDPEVP
jgi:hypothetical protein